MTSWWWGLSQKVRKHHVETLLSTDWLEPHFSHCLHDNKSSSICNHRSLHGWREWSRECFWYIAKLSIFLLKHQLIIVATNRGALESLRMRKVAVDVWRKAKIPTLYVKCFFPMMRLDLLIVKSSIPSVIFLNAEGRYLNQRIFRCALALRSKFF